MGHKSWNKLFEQEYLPQLIAQENTTDPVTGLSRQNARAAQEWVDLAISEPKKLRFHSTDASGTVRSTYNYEEEGEKRGEMARPSSLPALSYKEKHREVAVASQRNGKKQKKEQGRDGKDANYASVTHHQADSLMLMRPDFKLGVKHGDSSRMRFPMREFLESDLRVKKVRNGKSMISLEEPTETKEDLFPTLHIKRTLAQGIHSASPVLRSSPKKARNSPNLRARHSSLGQRQAKEPEQEKDLESKLEGALRDEFLNMMESKMTNLDKELQHRREMREEAYKSKEILLKAADSLQKRHPNAPVENIWNAAKSAASSDPTMLPARLSLYLRIVQYVEKQGGIRTEPQEQIVYMIKEELEQGHPADKSILSTVLIEHGIAIVNDMVLRDLLRFVADQVNVSPVEIAKLFELYEKQSHLKTPYIPKKQPKQLMPNSDMLPPSFNPVASSDLGSTRLAAAARTASYFPPRLVPAEPPAPPPVPIGSETPLIRLKSEILGSPGVLASRSLKNMRTKSFDNAKSKLETQLHIRHVSERPDMPGSDKRFTSSPLLPSKSLNDISIKMPESSSPMKVGPSRSLNDLYGRSMPPKLEKALPSRSMNDLRSTMSDKNISTSYKEKKSPLSTSISAKDLKLRPPEYAFQRVDQSASMQEFKPIRSLHDVVHSVSHMKSTTQTGSPTIAKQLNDLKLESPDSYTITPVAHIPKLTL